MEKSYHSGSMLLFMMFFCQSIGNTFSEKKVKDLQIIVEHKPDVCNEFAAIGDTVHVDYTIIKIPQTLLLQRLYGDPLSYRAIKKGMLEDGRIFDTSLRDGRGPLKVQLGGGTLIKGWERGIHGMCIGERRKLIIPPHLAYGSKGVDRVIPPDATLIFTVQLANLERKTVWGRLEGLASFAIWPLSILLLLYYLYTKVTKSVEEERRPEKRAGKKRR